MCCCGNDDAIETKKIVWIENNRKCTDVFFLLLFIVGCAMSIYMAVEVFKQDSSIYHTIYGVDLDGNICGKTPGFEQLKYAAWPVLPTPLHPEYYKIKVCVAHCSYTSDPNSPAKDFFTNTQNVFNGYDSWSFARLCLPKIPFQSKLISVVQNAARTVADMFVAWKPILVACLASVILCFIYVKLLKFSVLRHILIWGSIIAIFGAFAALAWVLYSFYKDHVHDVTEAFDRGEAAYIGFWIVVGLGVIYLLVVLFSIRRINFAINVLGVAMCAVDQIKSIVFYPIIPLLFLIMYLVYWVAVALFMFAIKTSTVEALPSVYQTIIAFHNIKTTYMVFEWDDSYMYLMIYHVFHLFWLSQFIKYSAYLTVSGAIAEWFFSDPVPGNPKRRMTGDGENKLSHTPVLSSMCRVLGNHLGTVAFASLLLAVLKTIRAIVHYIRSQIKKENRVGRCLLACLACCIKCIEKCVDFMSKNALIWCAITGSNFCSSGAQVWGLLLLNIGRASAVKVVGGFLFLFGRILISLLTAMGVGLYVNYHLQYEVFSTFMPVALTLVYTMILSSLIFSSLEASVETMFICFLADPERTKATDKMEKAFMQVPPDNDNRVHPAQTNSPPYYDKGTAYNQPPQHSQSYAPVPQYSQAYASPPPQYGGGYGGGYGDAYGNV